MDSIMQQRRECYICRTTQGLERHHVYAGSRRKAADKWGCWVWLCHEHHTGRFGVQYDAAAALRLKAECQRAFERRHGHEQFMKVFGKNYLED